MMKKLKDNIHSKAFIDGIIIAQENDEVTYYKHNDSTVIKHKNPINHIILSIPIIRGNVKMINNLYLGLRSFNLTLLEIDRRLKEETKKEESENPFFEKEEKILKKLKVNLIQLLSFLGIFLGLFFSLIMFIIVPSVLTTMLTNFLSNRIILNLIEGFLRILIFVGFIFLTKNIPEIKTIYMYHAAEHKILNSSKDSSFEEVKKSSKYYWNCASVQLYKLTLCVILFFSFISGYNIFIIDVFLRILLIPILLGVLYEIKVIFDEDKSISFIDKLIQSVILVEPTDEVLSSVLKASMELKERR